MKQGKKRNTLFIVIVLLIILVAIFIGIFSFFKKPNEDLFKAPGRNWNSSKKVEDYFVERLHMSQEEASNIRTQPGVDGAVNLRITPNVTLDGLIGNLQYYGFIRDEKTFRYALEYTNDTTPNEKAIKVGNNGTIDVNAEYRISEDMSAWELADILLNKPSGHFSFDEYNYFFMP